MYQFIEMKDLAISGITLLALGAAIILAVSQWKLFEKCGYKGWVSLIPFYNIIVLLKIINKPIKWAFLLFIPAINVIVLMILLHRLSISFGKDIDFTIGLFLMPFVFFPMLSFSKERYVRLEKEYERLGY